MKRPAHRGRYVGRRLLVAGALVLAGVVIVAVTLPGLANPSALGSIDRLAHPRRRAPRRPATWQGPDGIEARWVVAENAKLGTTAWLINGAAGGIDGYASAVQATAGQHVTLYVSTAAPTYEVTAYRMGYYQGKGARQIWQSPVETGVVQSPCPLTPRINMVQCSWTPSLGFTVSSAWVQGDYLLKLVGSANQQSYVPLTVWDPGSRVTYLIQNSVLTWQAWNTYGGYDFYGGAAPGQTPTYDDRARVVSFDRPYASSFGGGAADFLGEEYPLVRFAEEHGLDVTYGTDITTAEWPGLLEHHRSFLSLGHDEQWSLEMRDAAQAALGAGINLVFFGASPVLRKVRLQPSPLGPDRQVVNYRDPQDDPLYATDPAQVSENQWTQPPASWSPSELVGSTYLGYGIDVPLVVTDASSWLYAGTGLANGAQLPGVIRSDFNGYVPGPADPPDVEILAHSPAAPQQGTTGFADTIYYTAPGGGGVFSTGTNGWIPAMGCSPSSSSCPVKALEEMTDNLLRLFGSGPAARLQPAAANWKAYYPG